MKHNGYYSFLGIDISKGWFDLVIIKSGNPYKYKTGKFAFTKEGLITFLKFLVLKLIKR